MHGVEDLAPLAAWSLAYATRSLSVTRPRLQSPRGSAPVWVGDPLPPGRRNPQWTRVSGAYAAKSCAEATASGYPMGWLSEGL